MAAKRIADTEPRVHAVTIVVRDEGEVEGYPGTNKTIIQHGEAVIGMLQYADMWRGGTKQTLYNPKNSTVRLDKEVTTVDGYSNLQIQLNKHPGGKKRTTIANVLVDPKLDVADDTDRQHVLSRVKEELTNSLKSKNSKGHTLRMCKDRCP